MSDTQETSDTVTNENETLHPPVEDRECPVCHAPYQDISGIRLPELEEERMIDMRGIVRECQSTEPPNDREAEGPWTFWHTREDLNSRGDTA